MHSTIVLNRQTAAAEVIETIERYGKEVDRRLAEVFEPLLSEGESLPDYALFQELIARAVQAALDELLAADREHLSVLRQIHEQRQAKAAGPALEFLRARLVKTQAARWRAVEEFDLTLSGFLRVLEALYALADEDEAASVLRPPDPEEERLPPMPLPLAAPAPPLPPEEDTDPLERRILSRGSRPWVPDRWLGTRVFRRRRSSRPG